MDLFPLGLWNYLTGGLLIGAGVSLIFLSTGIIAGASSFFSSTLSWISGGTHFQQKKYTDSRVWRLLLSCGLIGGAFLFTVTLNGGESFVTEVQWWRLALGGLFVGVGTRMSRGCTSGHGICGLSSWSLPSFLAVGTFMGIAILTAFICGQAGVLP